ncbi:12316_t:CDS:2 [Entrophospora sp. SA101]|nr:12316_t:CDS:2 [Entrophospora sp. SA101]
MIHNQSLQMITITNEDEFGVKGKNLFKQSLVHSFIIDIEDTFIKDEFTGERISEIVEKRNGQSRPEIDEKLFEYINTFAKVRRLVWPVLKEKTDTGPWQYIGPTQQKAIGKKGDAYVRMFGSTSTGWVASEAGQKWEGAHGTKFMEETSLSL